jgi:hypothetical protein
MPKSKGLDNAYHLMGTVRFLFLGGGSGGAKPNTVWCSLPSNNVSGKLNSSARSETGCGRARKTFGGRVPMGIWKIKIRSWSLTQLLLITALLLLLMHIIINS